MKVPSNLMGKIVHFEGRDSHDNSYTILLKVTKYSHLENQWFYDGDFIAGTRHKWNINSYGYVSHRIVPVDELPLYIGRYKYTSDLLATLIKGG